VQKTTVYLPDDLKRDLEALAARNATSEAELIREAIRRRVAPVKARGGLFSDPDFDPTRTDEYLAGFGEH
jgi:Ribbon-helix-helix protein, copG family